MTESGPASGDRSASTDEPRTAGLVIGWAVTGLGALLDVVTVGVCLYLMVTADSGIQFVGWFFIMLFFGAFPAMAGLGLIIWGGRIVRRARSKQRPG